MHIVEAFVEVIVAGYLLLMAVIDFKEKQIPCNFATTAYH